MVTVVNISSITICTWVTGTGQKEQKATVIPSMKLTWFRNGSEQQILPMAVLKMFALAKYNIVANTTKIQVKHSTFDIQRCAHLCEELAQQISKQGVWRESYINITQTGRKQRCQTNVHSHLCSSLLKSMCCKTVKGGDHPPNSSVRLVWWE